MSTETTAADDWAETFEGQILDGRYEIEGLLGSGGMGAVFRGRQIQLRKPVAIKLLRPEYGHRKIHRERFLREARAASRIGHRNVVDISDFGETPDGRVFFVMELLEGEDLAKTLRREGPMPWSRARGILLQIIRGLKAAHAKSVIHRDVKPANVFLVHTPDDEPDDVKMLDFGVAKVTDPADSAAAGLTSGDKVMGTAMYMAPEQALGKVADARSDVYAVGCVAYQLLAGRPAFGGTNALEILMRRLNEPPPSLADDAPHLAGPIEAYVRRAMARDPMARFQSMKEMESALREIPTDAASEPAALVTAPGGQAHVDDADTSTSTSAHRRGGVRNADGLPAHAGVTPPSGVPTEAVAVHSDEAESGGRTEPVEPAGRLGVEGPSTSPVLHVPAPEPSSAGWGLRVAVPAIAVALGVGVFWAWQPSPSEHAAPATVSAPRTAEKPQSSGSASRPSGAAVKDETSATPPGPDASGTGDRPPSGALPGAEAGSAAPATAPDPEATPASSPAPAPPTEPPTVAKPKPKPKAKPQAKPTPSPAPRDVERTSAKLVRRIRSECTAPAGTSVSVTFNIESSGKPSAVQARAGGVAELAECVRTIVRAARFGAGDLEAGAFDVTW